MSKEIIVLEEINAIDFFTKGDGVDDILQRIANAAREHVPDISTKKGQAEIKKNVTLVTKSKTYLESKGKELAAEYKAIPKKIDENRRKTKEFLNALQEEVRKPLTDYEAEQAAKELAKKVEEDHDFALFMNEKFNEEQAAAKAEAERLVKEERERYEAQVNADAEAKAKAEAEQKLKLAEQALEDEKRKAAQAIIDAENEAARVAKQAEADRLAEIARHEAEKKSIIDAEEAAKKAEAQRIEALEKAEEARKADTEYRRKINNEILGAMIEIGVSTASAKKLITALAKNEINHVTINY